MAPTAEEIGYLRAVHDHYFPAVAGDPVAAWAGLRVLPAGPGRPFSRTREVLFHRERYGGGRVLTVQGGKLTGYRITAEKVLRLLGKTGLVPDRERRADTATLKLPDDPGPPLGDG